VHPLGLVAKGPTWYLVASTDAGLRTFRLSRIRAVEATALPARRPEGFDLDQAWQSIMATLDERRLPARATVHADAGIVDVLRYVLGTRVTVVEPATEQHPTASLEVRGQNPHIIAAQLAGFAEHVEVVAPDEVRTHLAQLGRALTERYARAV
jgi:predicted DNA-binding transcriptional regulator YafY